MDIRLVAIDLDGTLLHGDQTVSERTVRAIENAQKKGVEIAVCTGRAVCECRAVLQALPPIRYGCYLTGALVQEDGRPIYYRPIPLADAKGIFRLLRQYDCMVGFFCGGEVYNDRRDIENFERYYPLRMKPLFEQTHRIVDDLDAFCEAYSGDVDKFYVSFSGLDERDRCMAEAKKLPYYVTSAGFVDLEIMHPEADKACALSALCGHLQLSPQQVCAIGDSSNDAPMIRFAGLGAAVANAPQSLKDIADLTAPSNEEDGVAWVLENLENF